MRGHVDFVWVCSLLFFGTNVQQIWIRVSTTHAVKRANIDGTGQTTIASRLPKPVYTISLDNNNHVCWGQTRKCCRTVLT